ncbi:alpha/beta hydrolase [Stutzerimonas urumqiensis]|uniref:alpha/beta hydrolase fold domain-containing protein n=1 Tax=Stutzerimonas urumqiensis TaxID=638269 RepID=UPI003BAA37DD
MQTPSKAFVRPVMAAVLLCGATLFGASAWSAPVERAELFKQPHTRYAGGVIGLPDIEYSSVVGYRPLNLDLYLPVARHKKYPAVVYIHGGGWRTGSSTGTAIDTLPGTWPEALAEVASRGYVVAAINYRLAGEARFPAQLHDAKAAVRWLRANAQTYGIDPDRIVAWGGSAGGHLAALLGTTGGVDALEGSGGNPEYSSRVQAVVNYYGLTDLLSLDSEPIPGGLVHDSPEAAETGLLGCQLSECPDKAAAASAVTYVSGDDAAFLNVHGTHDLAVSPQQARAIHTALQTAGVYSELMYVDGANHIFKGTSPAQAADILRTTIEFIDRQVGNRR